MKSILQKIKSEFFNKKFIKYAIGGVTGLVVDTIILYILEKTLFDKESTEILGIIYPAKLISSIFGVATAFLINKYWSFESKGNIGIESSKMVVSFILTILISVPIYGIYFNLLQYQSIMDFREGFEISLANLLTSATTMIMNFFVQKYLIFIDGVESKSTKKSVSEPTRES